MDNLVKLKQFRQKYKLTQNRVAESIGIDQRQWNRYENEKNEMPIRYLKAICQNFNVSADWLLGLQESEEQQQSMTEQLYNIVVEILTWATQQDHIDEEQMVLLVRAISKEKEKLLNKEGGN